MANYYYLYTNLNQSELVLHLDNGSPMKGSMLHQLGVVSSFSSPRVSNDNAYSESLFRTLKYRAGSSSNPAPCRCRRDRGSSDVAGDIAAGRVPHIPQHWHSCSGR
ncbi:MAG: hypothetical protein OIF57_11990 [Marinobacterium sp.]|nr:hypothetical protein [Marinobacterium sp.]